MAVGAPASIIAAYRLLFATILLAPFVMLSYPNFFKNISVKNWLVCIGAGICLALHFVFWFESLKHTSVASSVVIVSVQPILRLSVRISFSLNVFLLGSLLVCLLRLSGQ